MISANDLCTEDEKWLVTSGLLSRSDVINVVQRNLGTTQKSIRSSEALVAALSSRLNRRVIRRCLE